MGYQIISGDPQEFEVIEYPTFEDERELHRLFVRTSEDIIPYDQKQALCEKWGWDPDEACEEKVTGYIGYHLALAQVIFTEDVDPSDAGKLKPGLIQEARADFIEGCQGRQSEQPGALPQGLMATIRSLIGQNGATSETETSPPTSKP